MSAGYPLFKVPKTPTWKKPDFWIVLLLTAWLVFALTKLARASDYTDSQIADAIYLAEGGSRAKVPYGILSVKVANEAEARKVCLNTIRNNRKRYAEYGYKKYPDYLSFLASRYCPVGASNDPRGLNKNWVKNVKYFLQRGA